MQLPRLLPDPPSEENMNSFHRIALTILLLASAWFPLRAKEEKPRYLDAITIFQCDFGEEWDVNYDGWPDRWRRERGPDHPHYVEMEIAKDPGINQGRCLQICLDGARARVFSPPIRVLPKFSYQLELKLKTSGLEHSRVTIVLDFMTASGEVVQTHRSEPFGQTKGWIDVKIGKFRPMFPSIDRVVVRLEVERGDRGDLNGVVSLADLWLSRWPSMEVTTNSRFNVYDDPDNVVITCSLAGIAEQQPIIKFQLLDATQTELLKEGAVGMKTLAGRIISEESRQTSEMIDGDGKHSDGYEGSTQWEPNIRDNGEYGFYRVHVSMISKNGGVMDQRTITLAVVKEIKSSLTSNIKPAKGEFGWSLPESVPRFGKPLDFATLQELLPLAGVSWVKVPVWFPREEQARGDEIIQFAERLAATDIETVGVIQSPEKWESGSDSGSEGSDIEFIFRKDPSSWLPLFDHVMNRLSLRLRWWQLGYDHDTSFVGYEDLNDKVAEIRRQLYRFGQDIRLGIGWRWNEAPLEGNLSWDYEQLSADPALRSAQLDEKLVTRPVGAAPRWVLIEPVVELEDSAAKTLQEQHEARVREFIKQIVVAKKHGVQGIFVSHPFSGPMGVMSEDGTPGELLLPWRTAATLLGGRATSARCNSPTRARTGSSCVRTSRW